MRNGSVEPFLCWVRCLTGRILMTSNAASFVGNIPHHYDEGLGPVVFVDYAADMARRVGARPVSRVLETAAGTGIVSRGPRRMTLSRCDGRLTSDSCLISSKIGDRTLHRFV